MPNSRRLSDEQLSSINIREDQAYRLYVQAAGDSESYKSFAKSAIACSLIFADYGRSLPIDQERRIEALFWKCVSKFSDRLLPHRPWYRDFFIKGNETQSELENKRFAVIRCLGWWTQWNALTVKVVGAMKKVLAVMGWYYGGFMQADDVEMVDVDGEGDSSGHGRPPVDCAEDLMARYAVLLGQEMVSIGQMVEQLHEIERRLRKMEVERAEDDEDEDDELEEEEAEDQGGDEDQENGDEEREEREESDTYDADYEDEDDDEQVEEEDVEMEATYGAITQLPVRGRPGQADCDIDVN